MVLFSADGRPQAQPDQSEPPIIAEARRRVDHLVSGAKLLSPDINERTEAVIELFRQSIDMADGECRLSLCVWGVRVDLTEHIRPRDAANDEKLVGFLASVFDKFTRTLDQYRKKAGPPP